MREHLKKEKAGREEKEETMPKAEHEEKTR